MSDIIALNPFSYKSISEPVPKSYLCHTSLMPMYINTKSGFRSKTSDLYLVRRSETLFPLIPFPLS